MNLQLFKSAATWNMKLVYCTVALSTIQRGGYFSTDDKRKQNVFDSCHLIYPLSCINKQVFKYFTN
mgnify:CR=1 FL=1